MTLDELRVAISASPNAEELQQIQISCPNRNIELTGLSAIYQFLIDQINGFETLEKHRFFDTSKTRLEGIKWGITQEFKQFPPRLQSQKIALETFLNDSNLILSSETTTLFLNDLLTHYPIARNNKNYYFYGACNALDFIDNNLESFPSFDQYTKSSEQMFLTGFILGYEFNYQKDSAIVSRRKTEKNLSTNSEVTFKLI